MNTLLIYLQETPNETCTCCKESTECRPYGKNGAAICLPCAVKPENIQEAAKQRARVKLSESGRDN